MINKIKKLLVKENGQIIPQRINYNYLQKQKLLHYINNQFNDSYSLSEKVYCIVNGLKERPRCKQCKKELKFKHNHYSTFCSRKCSNSNEETLNKIKRNVSKSLKQTYKNNRDQIKEKRSKTLFNKYNIKVYTPFAIKEIQDKSKDTIKSKYGVENIFHLKNKRGDGGNISREYSILRNKINGYDIEYVDKNKIKVKNLCKLHGDIEIEANNFYNRAYKGRNGIICNMCNPINSFSSFEKDFENFLKEHNVINYEKNTRKVIKPYELDFYFDQLNLAIELNGIYWHSILFKNKNYHYLKSNLCNEQHINLIHIWEDDFYEKRKLIESLVLSKLKILDNNKLVYAKNTLIRSLDITTYNFFLKENHLEGEVNSTIMYGLYYNDELVYVMGFEQIDNDLNKYELKRFCNKQHYNVIDGDKTLFEYFINNNSFLEIISYCNRDYNDINFFKNNGFKLKEVLGPENRNKKDSVIKCFDSGKLTYILTKDNLECKTSC